MGVFSGPHGVTGKPAISPAIPKMKTLYLLSFIILINSYGAGARSAGTAEAEDHVQERIDIPETLPDDYGWMFPEPAKKQIIVRQVEVENPMMNVELYKYKAHLEKLEKARARALL